MRKELIFSILRKLLIAGLLVSAVLLTLRTDFYTGTERVLPAADGTGKETERVSSADAAAALRPRAVLVRYADGTAAASAYDGETTEQAFLRFSAFLGEALGSAGTPAEITETEFRDGLSGGGVFVDLGGSFPLELLSAWMGAGGGGAAALRADLLYLGLTETGVELRFRDGAGFFRCATGAQSESLRGRIEDFQATEAAFAFEKPLPEGAEPYTVLLETMPPVYAVSAVSARDAADPEKLMAAVGMNSYLASSYLDADGTEVLMEETRSLRLAPDGTASYRGSGSEREIASDEFSEAVSYAYRLVQRSAGAFCGDAEILLREVEGANGTVTVRFDYCVNGIPVRLTEGAAAEVVISGGILRRAVLRLRRYTVSEQAETMLPMLLSAAVAAADGGRAPSLVYMDGGDRVQPIWVNES